MRSSVSERSLIIESDDDDDERPQTQPSAAARSTRRHRHEDEERSGSGSDSDSGSSSSSCAPPRGPATASSYTQQWPQSYRSISCHLPLHFIHTPSVQKNAILESDNFNFNQIYIKNYKHL